MAGGLSRFLHPSRSHNAADLDDEQYAPDGRDLSDTTHPDYDPATDPELRLRVTRTAASSIHETIMEEDRRRQRRQQAARTGSGLKTRRSIFSRSKSSRRAGGSSAPTSPDLREPPEEQGGLVSLINNERRAEMERRVAAANAAQEAQESARRQDHQDGKKKGGRENKKVKGRRIVGVNCEEETRTDPSGYERNKVRTSKYTLLTFLPKNLFEQFCRVANIYFFLLIILQLFSIFGAAAPQVAMLPLAAVLAITGIKDGVEDYRRQQLDDGVNNSAVTRLGEWKNVNIPIAKTKWWQFGSSTRSSSVSRGVRKLREKEGVYDSTFLYGDGEQAETIEGNPNASSYTIDQPSYPPTSRPRSMTMESNSPSFSGRSRSSTHASSDVVDYTLPSAGTAKWERTLWKKLEVGDMVLLKEDDQIPADLVVLSTSDPEGVCFVETKNLDGETNLKQRKAVKATMGIGNEEDIEKAKFWVDSEAPHANLYSYNAVLRYRTKGEREGREHPVQENRKLETGGEKQEPITINELLLRGCALRNTKWVIGLVVFTGADTKIMMNQGETPSKRSKIEKETNFNVLVNFAVLIAICTASAVANGVYGNNKSRSSTYYEPGADVSNIIALDALVTFGSCLILFQNIVPVSLVITVELVKTLQAFFIYQDRDMYYEPLDHPCLPKTWNISDDLGQIEYVFSDKTGTLTQNIMDFQKCAVDGVAYGEGITEAMLGAAKREGRDTSAFEPAQNLSVLTEARSTMIKTLNGAFKNRYMQPEKVTLISPSLAKDLVSRNDQSRKIVDFWRALAICHTVLADRSDAEDTNKIEYKAESPDEAALVSAARDLGFVFISRTNNEIEIEVMGQPERYTPLRVLEFNSTRKRMSTLVRTPDNRILLICKGADSVIYKRLRADHDPEVIASTTKHLEDFSNAGLRTLCISSKYVSEEEFQKWSKIYDKACAAIEDREDEIERACEMIETDLVILGATALEDKLQEGVPEAIAQLHRAGLKLWILTGDKLQTAIEIGFSCNLLTNDMELMIISADSEEGARSQIEAGLDKIRQERSGQNVKEGSEKPSGTGEFAVVIDGETLRFALDDPLKAAFLDLTTQCETVVCCRVSPSQKALTVKLVKDGRGAMTLAIGDGANDVAMIQEAHIGVGIAGLEGAQASMSADYAVGQFRFLTKLLIVHGRWCYIRVADMHSTFFYKNVVWTISLFLYQFFCNFDSTYLYDYTLIMLFNLAFTSLPVAVLGIFDRDVSATTALAMPELYRRGIKGLEYNRPIFFAFMLDGLYQSGVAFFVPYAVYAYSTTLSITGHDFSVWEFGTTVAACAITLANLYVGLHIRYWTWMVFVIIIGSTLLFHIWICIYSQFQIFTFENELIYLYSTLNFWTSLVFTLILGLAPKYVWKYCQTAYWPHDSDIVREMEVFGSSFTNDAEAQSPTLQAEQHPLARNRVTSAGSDVFSADSHALPYSPAHFSTTPPPTFDFITGSSSQPKAAIPEINIVGETPRGSMASRRNDSDDWRISTYGAGTDHYTSYADPSSPDLGSSSVDLIGRSDGRPPIDRRQRSNRSDGSWETAKEEPGYAM